MPLEIDDKKYQELGKMSFDIAKEVHRIIMNKVNVLNVGDQYRSHIVLNTIISLLGKNSVITARSIHGKTFKESLSIVNDHVSSTLNAFLALFSEDINPDEINTCDDPDHNHSTH